jgi:hypothetical protein
MSSYIYIHKIDFIAFPGEFPRFFRVLHIFPSLAKKLPETESQYYLQ